MNENHVDDLLSPALDGELSPREEREFQAHLDRCERCAGAYAGLRRSVDAMRRAEVPPLAAGDVAATVAAAFPEVSPAPLPFTQARPAARTTPWPLFLSHAAAVLLGCTLMFGGRALFFTGEPGPGTPPGTIEGPIEIVREVEVEVPVEVIVHVPKEVIREVRVEVPVEVEVEVEKIVQKIVERRVPHPLQRRLDAGYAVASNVTELAVLGARGLGGALEIAAARSALEENAIALAEADPADASGRGTGESELGPRDQDSRPLALGAGGGGGAPRRGAASALVIQRDGNRLSLRTRGPREVVVPALIDALDGSDRALADAARGQLMNIRDRMIESGLDTGVFPGEGQRSSAAFGGSVDGSIGGSFGRSADGPIDRAGGLRGLLRQSRSQRAGSIDSSSRPASAEAWRTWWRGTSSGQ